MQKRRSHNKSRTGCQNCKKRHVKCDEQGPPCANCVVRETDDTCTFTSNNGSPSSTSIISAGFQNLTLSSESRKRLELELMHRWSTSTFESLCSMDQDRRWLQIDVPRWSLKHEFLLHGILALSAMEVALLGESATESQPMVYVRSALEYYDQASKAYRVELGNITEDNVQSVYVFSSVAVSINMALMQWEYLAGNALPQNMMARVAAMAELFRGSSSIAVTHTEHLMKGSAGNSIQIVVEELQRLPADPLPASLKQAIKRMRTVIDTSPPSPGDPAHKTMLHGAAEALVVAFVEDFKDAVRGVCISFPSLAGPAFGVALRAGEPLAMFLMIHWGVLLDRMGRLAWWARSIGKWMVLDLVDKLWVVEGMGEGWRGSLEWAREVVNMEDEERLKF